MSKLDPGLLRHSRAFVAEPPVLHADLSAIGLSIPAPEELAAARAIAARLIGPHIASLETFHAVAEKNAAGMMVYREQGQVTGVLAFLLLRPPALYALATDKFDAVNPDLELLARPDEEPLAAYGWGLAATSLRAAAVVLNGAGLFRGLTPSIPFFARAATVDGRRILCGRLGYTPFPRNTTGLLWSPSREMGTESA